MSELRKLMVQEATRRAPAKIKRDLRAYLDMLRLGEEMKDKEIIEFAKREIKALEDELVYNRYGTAAVK